MNPAQNALSTLQGIQSPQRPSYTNPTTGPLPAGEVGHNGPMVDPVQQAYEMLNKTTSYGAAGGK